jgi:hypothetical protein
VVEPLTAAALGGLALDKAQSAIIKWVTTQLTTRVEVALRDRVLRQGRPAKDQQTELVAVIKAAVDLTASEQFPAEERLQGLFRKALLDDPARDWPLVNGSDLTYLTLRNHAEAALIWVNVHSILFLQGNSLGDNGLVNDARRHFEDLHRLCNNALGPDHVDTFTTRSNLAGWQGLTGDVVGAVSASEAILTDVLRVFDSDHSLALATRHNLALSRGEAGDAAGAAFAYDELLPDLLRILGPDHPNTLSTRSQRARWHGEAGDATGAAAAFAELLSDQLRVLGSDHPDTLTARSNLAVWRGRQTGDAEKAAAATAELLADRLRVLGPDHPDTLTTRNNLAALQATAGDAARAAAAYAELLTDQHRILGPDHPRTLSTEKSLKYWQTRASES